MDEKGTEKKPLPINYRRAVKSTIWPIIAFVCVKERVTPNKLIDRLIIEEYWRIKNG